jgi:predicted dehydrogenase
MTNRKLRWGLLGTARINKAVIPPIRASSRNELAAVASRSLEKGESYAREWGIPRAVVGYATLVADPAIDAVYISLPNDLHVEWSIRCAEAGKHVLCEKPLALTVAEAERLVEAARRCQTVIAEAYMYRHHPQTLKTLELVRDGAIGPVRSVHGCFSYYLGREADVRWEPAMGGGSLWDVGCYPVSYTRFILGEEPVEVFGRQVTTEREVDHTFVGMMRFGSGALTSFDCGFRSAQRWGMEIVGEQGSITLSNPFKPGLKDTIVLHRGDATEEIPAPPMELYIGEIDDMADAVLDGKPQRISLEDSLANTRALVALYQSAREGRVIAL